MSARDQVLARIRAALGPDPDVPEVPRDYRTSSDLDPATVVDLFAERVDDYRAEVHRTTTRELPSLLAALIDTHRHRRVVVPAGLDGDWLTGLHDRVQVCSDLGRLTTRELDTFDVVITAAAVGIAETGTIILDAHRDQGRRALTLVPDHHICVVTHAQVVATLPEGLARLDPTRPLTLISGPSATSDIELDRVEGVHGPRTLDVVLLDEG